MKTKQLNKKLKGYSVYLGEDKEGIKYYLDKPSWECDWYWGFGYIQGYNKRRHQSHEHADNFLSEWFTKWNGSEPRLLNKTFNDKEGWEITELFQQFYHLKEQAGFWGRGKMNCGNTTIENWENKELVNKINKKMLPVIMNRIMEILTPIIN